MMRIRLDFDINESRSTMVSLDARNGTCTPGMPRFLASSAHTHSFSARSDLLISAPSSLLYLLLL